MRKAMAGGVAALAMGGALLTGTVPAAAAAPEGAAVQQSVAADHVYHSWYWTESNCENNGARLQVRGTISDYFCNQSPYLTYYLYVIYS